LVEDFSEDLKFVKNSLQFPWHIAQGSAKCAQLLDAGQQLPRDLGDTDATCHDA
jgi:hypothetical protein